MDGNVMVSMDWGYRSVCNLSAGRGGRGCGPSVRKGGGGGPKKGPGNASMDLKEDVSTLVVCL